MLTSCAELHALQRAAGMVERDTGEPKYALHAFRHAFTSWCINSKERGGRPLPPKEVQVLLVTLETYSHLFPPGNDHSELAAASAALLA